MSNELLGFQSYRIMLLDDHELFGQSLILMLHNLVPGAEVSYYKNIEEARRELSKKVYHFLLTDLVVNSVDLHEQIRAIKQTFPSLLIIIVSGITELRTVKRSVELGVNAYVSKMASPFELKLALERAMAGRKFISSDLSAEMLSKDGQVVDSTLTQKELEVLKFIAAGKNVRGTAEMMSISPFTVMAHRRNIMKKLELHSAAELVGYAYKNNLI